MRFPFNSSFTLSLSMLARWVFMWNKHEVSFHFNCHISLLLPLSTRVCCNCKQSISLSTLLSWVRERKKFFLLNGKIIKFPLPTTFSHENSTDFLLRFAKIYAQLIQSVPFPSWLRLLLFFLNSHDEIIFLINFLPYKAYVCSDEIRLSKEISRTYVIQYVDFLLTFTLT